MYNVLIIEDSKLLRNNLVKILSGIEWIDNLYEAENGEEGMEILQRKSIDLVITDLAMPKADGFSFLDRKGQDERWRHIPVIILTGSVEIQTKVQGFELGAVDYVTKPFEPAELIGRVKAQLKIKKLQDELQKANKRLEVLSNTDELTQLYNRRYFMILFEREFERSRRYHLPLCLMMIDIDHFKEVNDKYGHLAGDQVLVSVAHLIRSVVRNIDLTARYGGEEFIILLPETDLRQGKEAAERLRQRVEASRIRLRDQGPVRITASFGIASSPRSDIQNVDDFIRLADEALYRAKQKGRNRVEN